MHNNASYRKIYLRNILISLVVVILLIAFAGFSVHQGKERILSTQEQVFRVWGRVYQNSRERDSLFRQICPEQLSPRGEIPEALSGGIPATELLAAFQAREDSLLLSHLLSGGQPATSTATGSYLDLSRAIQERGKEYNDRARESNHFMKAFPNNIYSAMFRIPSLPDYSYIPKYLNYIKHYLNIY